MVDFAAIKVARAAQAAKDKAAYVPLQKAPEPEGLEKAKPLPKPRAEGRDRDEDLLLLSDLLDKVKITAWETTFCKSVLLQLQRSSDNSVSVKQGVILDKLEKEYFSNASADPTPKGNPPAQYQKPAPAPERQRPSYGFDDMDDDIPF